MLTIPTLILTSDTNRASPLRGGDGGGGGGRGKGETIKLQTITETRAEQVCWKYELLAVVDAVKL